MNHDISIITSIIIETSAITMNEKGKERKTFNRIRFIYPT